VSVYDFHEVRVRALRLEFLVVANLPAHIKYIVPVQAMNEKNAMGDACIDEADFNRSLFEHNRNIDLHALRLCQSHFYYVSSDLGFDDACPSLEGHFFFCDPSDIGESGGTSGPVSAHIHFAAVGVEKPPPEISALGIFDNDQSIRAHRHLPFAYVSYEFCDVSDSEGPIPVVNQDEIISTAAHLQKIYHWD
jgi:hypothetical protein